MNEEAPGESPAFLLGSVSLIEECVEHAEQGFLIGGCEVLDSAEALAEAHGRRPRILGDRPEPQDLVSTHTERMCE